MQKLLPVCALLLGTSWLLADSSVVSTSFFAPAAATPDSVLVLRGRVIDGTGTPALEQGAVVMRAGRVVAVGVRSKIRIPKGARALDVGSSHTILPGLIDLHLHLRPQYTAWLLPAGITTARDANNSLDVLAQVRSIWPYAPRVLYSGPLLDGPASVFRELLKSSGFFDSALAAAVRPATAGSFGSVISLEAATPARARAQ